MNELKMYSYIFDIDVACIKNQNIRIEICSKFLNETKLIRHPQPIYTNKHYWQNKHNTFVLFFCWCLEFPIRFIRSY